MSERTERMIGSISPWEREDPHVLAVLGSTGLEFDRIEAMMQAVREHAWPHRATDEYGLLSVHERTFQVPVAPEGLSVAQRQAILKAQAGRRRDGRKGTWAGRMDDLVGPGLWTVEQHTPLDHQITVTLSADPDSGLAARVVDVIQRFTPAVEQVIVQYAERFLLGESPLGDTIL